MRNETVVAWDSNQLGTSIVPETSTMGVEGKYMQIRTDRAIFVRAFVLKETRDMLTVRYVEKTGKDGGIVRRTQNIKKRDIVNYQVAKD